MLVWMNEQRQTEVVDRKSETSMQQVKSVIRRKSHRDRQGVCYQKPMAIPASKSCINMAWRGDRQRKILDTAADELRAITGQKRYYERKKSIASFKLRQDAHRVMVTLRGRSHYGFWIAWSL